jgi:predicted MPP superfamily phosphohydrolase
MFVDSVRAAGATVLDNKMTIYDGVQIAGTLYHGGKENPEMAKVLSDLEIDINQPSILINHPPTDFIAPHQHGINLIVSGHTHQGQFWPLRYITHLVYDTYDYGMHPYESLTSITSNGIGTYGPPMRLFNSPEVVVITFRTE